MYQYQEIRKRIFSDAGQRLFLKIRDGVGNRLKLSGAFTMGAALDICCADNWVVMACVDRMVELGEIVEIKQDDPAGQDRVFVRAT